MSKGFAKVAPTLVDPNNESDRELILEWLNSSELIGECELKDNISHKQFKDIFCDFKTQLIKSNFLYSTAVITKKRSVFLDAKEWKIEINNYLRRFSTSLAKYKKLKGIA